MDDAFGKSQRGLDLVSHDEITWAIFSGLAVRERRWNGEMSSWLYLVV